MRLYTTGRGHWAGTQADARKLKKEHGVPCDMQEVPVAKGELLDFLNGNTVATMGLGDYTKPVWSGSHYSTKTTPSETSVPQEEQSLPAFEGDGGERGAQNYIGKTSVLAAGDGLGMGKFKLHIYFYTEGGSY